MTTIDRRDVFGLLAASMLPPLTARAANDLLLAELPGNVPAPEFELLDLSGKLQRLSAFRGRPVLVNFWAVWCPPCRRELAELADLRMKLAASSFEILALNLGDSVERINAFLASHPAPNLPILLDAEKTSAAPWHVSASGLPVAYAVDRAGTLRLGAIGERNWRSPDIERQLRSLIAT
jgi:thiol-disulfide isomerase/thioredoxin